MGFKIKEQIVYYKEEWRRSWADGGTWKHSNRYGFHEAVVAAHFRLRGWEVVRDFSVTNMTPQKQVTRNFTKLVHDFVGKPISDFFINELKKTAGDSGQPDLFVFHEATPNDPKIKYPGYPEDLLWFFVECKGLDEPIRETQLNFWRLIAQKDDDLDLGSKRIRLFRALPCKTSYEPKEYDY